MSNLDSVKNVWLYAVGLAISCLLFQTIGWLPGPNLFEFPANLLLYTSTLTILVSLVSAPVLACYEGVRSVVRRRVPGALANGLLKSLGWIVLGVLSLATMIAGLWAQHFALVRAAERGESIIGALERWQADHDKYPADMGDLVPEYLSAIPQTGMMAFPRYQYRSDFDDPKAEESRYELRINCGMPIDFDRFIYWPSERYPDRIDGNPVGRIGRWAHVND